MKALEEKILTEGRVLPGNILLVDAFLNQQVDIDLMKQMAEEWHSYFGERPITKILTLEASGIALAALVAERFGVPLLFAKKYESHNITGERHQSIVHSYTKQKTYKIAVSKRLLTSEDHVLIIDDFLANGCALQALVDLVTHAGAMLEGIGIAIEKTFQPGGQNLRERGYEIYALAQIKAFDEETNDVVFEPEPIISIFSPERPKDQHG
jgi:xanthine phosphoribosyltransferase